MKNQRAASVLLWLAAGTTVVVAAGVSATHFYSVYGYTISADDSSHVMAAQHWRLKRWTVPGTTWLPLPAVITGEVISLFGNPFLTPRVLNQCIGLGVVALVALLALWIDGRRLAMFIAALLAAVHVPRVVLSAVPLSDIYYVFLLLAALAFAWRWLTAGHARYCLSAALCFAACTAVRYEGWLAASVFGAVVFLRMVMSTDPGRVRRLVLVMAVAILVSLFPAWWVLYNHTQDSGWFSFLSAPGSRYAKSHNPDLQLGLLWRDSVFFQILTVAFVSGNFAGLVKVASLAWKRPVLRWWIAIPGLSLLLLGAAGLHGTALPTHNFWRMAAPFSLMLIPFTASLLAELHGRVSKHSIFLARLATAAAVVLLVTLFARQRLEFPGGSSTMDKLDLQTAQRINRALETCDARVCPRIGITQDDWHAVHVRAAIAHPECVRSINIKSFIKGGQLDVALLREKRIGWVLAGAGNLALFQSCAGLQCEVDPLKRFVFATVQQ